MNKIKIALVTAAMVVASVFTAAPVMADTAPRPTRPSLPYTPVTIPPKPAPTQTPRVAYPVEVQAPVVTKAKPAPVKSHGTYVKKVYIKRPKPVVLPHKPAPVYTQAGVNAVLKALKSIFKN